MSPARSAAAARWRRPSPRFRLLALTVAPLALAGAVAAGPAAKPAHRASSRPGAAVAASAGALRPVHLPGLHARSYAVTLITGAKVTLSSVGGGRYTATSTPVPGPGWAVDITAQGTAAHLSSLQAVPEDARPLISTGRIDPGLFDVLYLARHGDTGTGGRIPVIIRHAGLGSALAHLPGVVATARPASGELEVSVAASRATAFWAAITTRSAAAHGPAGLADGATQLSLAGHDAAAQPSRAPASGQPLYPVTELVTRSTGPLQYSICDGAAVHLFCAAPFLLGVAGPALGQGFSPQETCLKLRPAKPYPVCDTLKFSYRAPAGVYFAGGNGGMVTGDNSDHTLENAVVELDVPQFTVAGPTTIRLNANDAKPVSVTTPLPTSDYGVPDSLESTRVLPDGTWSSSVTEAAYGDNNWWAVPSRAGQRATIGSYSFMPDVSLGRPPVTAFVTGPTHLALHPLYPMYSETYRNSLAHPNRFTGLQTLPLVNAGKGTAADFRRVDARGKLAMVRAVDGWVLPQQLVNADHAHAAGVLVDGASSGGYVNALPVYLYTNKSEPRVPRNMPFAEIDPQQAAALTRLLAHGTVHVTIDDTGQSPYAYFLSFNQEAQVPGSLQHTVTSRQLATVNASYHHAAPVGMAESPAAFPPDIFFAGGNSVVFAGPVTQREYYGPVSPETVWWLTPEIPEEAAGLPTLALFGRPGSETRNWDESPTALGAVAFDRRVNQAQPGKYPQYCAGCRQGNILYPVFWLASGANPGAEVDVGGFAPGSIHLYSQAGQQIKPILFAGVVTYKLPPQPAGYRLVTHFGSTSTAWRFTSAAPRRDETPPGTLCLGAAAGVSAAACGAAPLVFLRYNAYTSLTDSVTAPGVHRLAITGYHQAPGAPRIASLKLWISTNGGQRWRSVTAAGRHGTYQAFYTVPALADTNGYISIKAQAADAAGNTVAQTILNAYPLSARRT